ncbi:unnamed protein product, partial [Didymodactylos carnosus]
ATAGTYLQDRNVNELKAAMSSPQQQSSSYNRQQQNIQTDKTSQQLLNTNQSQKKVTINVSGSPINDNKRTNSKTLLTQINQVPKKSSFDDQSWIGSDNQRKTKQTTERQIKTNGFYSSNKNGREVPTSIIPSPNSGSNIALGLSGRRSTPALASQYHPQQQFYHQQEFSNHRLLTESNGYINDQSNYESSMRQKYGTNDKSPTRNRVLSVSGKLRCSKCSDELGQGSAMVIESLGLYYHIECFRCCVCNTQLSTGVEGTDVRVRNQRLHCQNCFSDENGMYLNVEK